MVAVRSASPSRNPRRSTRSRLPAGTRPYMGCSPHIWSGAPVDSSLGGGWHSAEVVDAIYKAIRNRRAVAVRS